MDQNTDGDFKNINNYNNFVKSEKQFGCNCKTRCICSPNAYHKYIMGPVTLELERIFKKYLFGYKCEENWADME
jgi:hypothetical protein